MSLLKESCYKLSNKIEIPSIGFGTWRLSAGEETKSSVLQALECGYRHIDTAAVYENEQSVGEAVAESGISRDQVFVTSKVWNSERGYEKTLAAFEQTLKRLNMDYLDLYLVHWPCNAKKSDEWEKINLSTWRALEKLYENGKVRAIGVSNFLPHHLISLVNGAHVLPMVNQIEYHLGFMQRETTEFCRQHGILVEAWGPLGSGELTNNIRLGEIAKKYNKSIAQLCIRWCLQNRTLPLPKSRNKERIAQNLQVFDFCISDEDMQKLNSLPFIGGKAMNPDEVKF